VEVAELTVRLRIHRAMDQYACELDVSAFCCAVLVATFLPV
jgi:hypothetical protein